MPKQNIHKNAQCEAKNNTTNVKAQKDAEGKYLSMNIFSQYVPCGVIINPLRVFKMSICIQTPVEKQ